MTAAEELVARIDRLPSEAQARVEAAIAKEEQVQRHLAALTAFQTNWTPEEQAAWDEGTKRRPWRTVAVALESMDSEVEG